MSCIFVITPLVMATGGWPIFVAAAVSTAAMMGYQKAVKGACVDSAEAGMNEIEITDENSKIVADTLAEDEKFILKKDGMEVEFAKDAAGRFAIHVRGKGIKESVLKAEGEKILGRIRQQYAYQQVMTEMEKRGFKLSNEEVGEDNRIRIKLERMV